MRGVLSNNWLKRCISVIASTYFVITLLLTLATFIYDLKFVEGMKGIFFALYGIVSIAFLIMMIYTKDVKLTKIISLIMLPVVFLLVIFNMYEWALIIPPFFVSLILFFVSESEANTKVILGTIYLLLYVLGIVAYIILNMLLRGSTVETIIDNNIDPQSKVYDIYKDQMEKIKEITDENNCISPDGKYRFYMVDVEDSDKGSVNIYVVPYGEDIELKFFTLKQQGIKKVITKRGTRGTVPSIGWKLVKDEESGIDYPAVEYQLNDKSDYNYVKIKEMPDKQYFEFIGIS